MFGLTMPNMLYPLVRSHDSHALSVPPGVML
jgi:hypothetical protein